MCISSYLRILFYNYYPIQFSIYGIFGFHYKLWNLVYSFILNVLFFIYIKNFRRKIFHHFFLKFHVFKASLRAALYEQEKYYPKPSSSFPPTFNKMHFGYFKTHLFKTFLHLFNLESFFGYILQFWGIFPSL